MEPMGPRQRAERTCFPEPQAAMAEGVSNISFGELSGNLGAAMYQYSFRIPAYYTLLVRLAS